jgi:hypothetical protein
MNANKFVRGAALLGLCCALGIGVCGALEDNSGDNQDQQGENIQGAEQLQEEIALVATTNAPAGATGQADLEVQDENGTNTAVVTVSTTGLVPGIYTVSVSLKSGSNSVVLGSFDTSASNQTDGVGTDNQDVQSNDGESDQQGQNGPQDQSGDVNNVEFGGDTGLPLPVDLNPMDIAMISVTDTQGVVLLVGDFSNLSQIAKGSFHAALAVEGGPMAPGASGQVRIKTVIRRGKARTAFSLVAQGVPAKQRFVLQINSNNAGVVKSNRKGSVRLNRLPRGVNPLSILSIKLQDNGGTDVLKCKF